MNFSVPGASSKGTYKLPPGLGAPSVSGADAGASPSCTDFHNMVSGSNQSPRNQAQLTLTAGSSTAALKAASSEGRSGEPGCTSTKPPGVAWTLWPGASVARKLRA